MDTNLAKLTWSSQTQPLLVVFLVNGDVFNVYVSPVFDENVSILMNFWEFDEICLNLKNFWEFLRIWCPVPNSVVSGVEQWYSGSQ